MSTSEMVQPTQGELVPTERDRDEAGFLMRQLGEPEDHISKFFDGLLDHTEVVQAFARHRLAALDEAAAAAQAEADKLEATAGALSGWTVARARIDQCQKVKAAILRKKEGRDGLGA